MDPDRSIPVSAEHLETLEKKVNLLSTLIDVSTIISSTLDYNELITIVMEKAKNVMDADACSILLYNRETNRLEFEVAISTENSTSDVLKKQITLAMGEGIAGWVAEHRTPIVIEDAHTDSRFFSQADSKTGFSTKSLIAVPLIGRSGLLGVAEILNPRNRTCFTEFDSEIFQTLCRQVSVAIENALFHKESLQRERMRQELDIASALQSSFLPEKPFLIKGDLTVSAVNISASKVGGDIYDFVEYEIGNVGILIGDVSGKGVSGALYMAKIISDFRYISHLANSPALVLSRLNSVLSRSPRGMFLTAIYCIIDPFTGSFTISVAGHPPFIWITEDEVKVMSVQSGPPLGIVPIEYPSVSYSLQSGDRLLFVTDGVFDAKDKDGNRLGYDTIVKFIQEHRQSKQILPLLVEYVNQFSEGEEQADDITIVEIRWGSA